jgi:hypothetical protein
VGEWGGAKWSGQKNRRVGRGGRLYTAGVVHGELGAERKKGVGVRLRHWLGVAMWMLAGGVGSGFGG